MLSDLTDILQLLRDAESYLVERGVPNAKRNADWLLAHVLGCRSPELYLTPYRVIDRASREAFQSLLRRRGKREPLQYILGSAEFMSLPFHMRQGVFIPRPDTEVLVEKVEALLRAQPSPRGPDNGGGTLTLLDLCCGTGVIGVSLACRLARLSCTAVDVDEGAVLLAGENAVLNSVEERVHCVRSDAAEFLRREMGTYDAVVCNPPYVPTADIEGLLPEVRDYEPRLGLDGGPDGLRCYRQVIPLIPRVTASGGVVAFETGDAQGRAVAALLETAGFVSAAVHKDYGDLDRVVTARMP
jgi:release factor glutamine methyltransferase